MVRELKEVRYLPQLKKNLISVGALEALSHAISVRDSVLKIRLNGGDEGCPTQ